MELPYIGYFFKYVTELLIEEEYLLLKQFVLTGCWHLADTSEEHIDIACRSRFYEVSIHRSWHVSLLDCLRIDQGSWRRIALPFEAWHRHIFICVIVSLICLDSWVFSLQYVNVSVIETHLCWLVSGRRDLYWLIIIPHQLLSRQRHSLVPIDIVWCAFFCICALNRLH